MPATRINVPIPSKEYLSLQQRLKQNSSLRPVQKRLEQMFVAELGLSTSGCKKAWNLMSELHRAAGFDHTSVYTFGDYGQLPVVVTQPYLEGGDGYELPSHPDTWTSTQQYAKRLSELLAIGVVKPSVIAANEWAFYYPGHASLVMICFPEGYLRLWKAYKDGIRAADLTLPAARP